jgi:hypothetical protein
MHTSHERIGKVERIVFTSETPWPELARGGKEPKVGWKGNGRRVSGFSPNTHTHAHSCSSPSPPLAPGVTTSLLRERAGSSQTAGDCSILHKLLLPRWMQTAEKLGTSHTAYRGRRKVGLTCEKLEGINCVANCISCLRDGGVWEEWRWSYTNQSWRWPSELNTRGLWGAPEPENRTPAVRQSPKTTSGPNM